MKIKTLIITTILLQLFAVSHFAQDAEKQSEAILIDAFSYTNREDMMARVDNYVVESQNNPTTSAYMIIKGNDAVRTKAEKELREYITQNRGLDKKRLFILNADGDKTAEIELWLIPPGAKPPALKQSANEKQPGVSVDKPEAILNNSFKNSNREVLLLELDNYINGLQDDPNAEGYIIINGNKSSRTNAEKQIREHLRNRRFNFDRIVFVNGEGGAMAEIELWTVPLGADPPAAKKPAKKQTSENNEPFIFSEEFVGGKSVCNARLDVEGYVEKLNENPDSRGNIVIYEISKSQFRQIESEILARLDHNGISRQRLKTFFEKTETKNSPKGIKLWLLP